VHGIVHADCPSLDDAFEAVIEWRQGRILASQADWLRSRQAAREWMDEAKLKNVGKEATYAC